MLQEALEGAGVPWSLCDYEDRGDGVLVVIPPAVAKSVLVESLPQQFRSRLVAYNQSHGAGERIRLRMALHAGEIHYDDHGVVGTAVNHAFRLLDAEAFRATLAGTDAVLAVITSSWFFDEVVWHSQPSTRAAYQPVRVEVKETSAVAWVCLPGVAVQCQAVVSPTRGPLPRQLPPCGRQFVGRRQELEQLAALLDAAGAEACTVVITAIAGTAGIGKTALATHWAHQAKERFPDGQLHINLRGFDPRVRVDPGQALHGFLEALGVVPSGIPGDLDAKSALYRSLIADRRMLIMLDNAASADQVRPLLPNTPTCLVIVTSRNRLDSLVVREGAYRLALNVLPVKDALELLARRITRERLDAEPQATADLIDLCARLPLALSIVAARAVNQPLRHLVRQFRDERTRLDALDLGEIDLSLRAVFSWSYGVLSNEAARLFRLLGVHPGPDIDIHACVALVGVSASRTSLTELVNAHLIEEHSAGRFRFHDLLRIYAAERAELDEPHVDRLVATRRIIYYYLRRALLADCRIQPFRGGEVRIAPPSADGPVITTYSDAMDWFMAENATLLAMINFAVRSGFGVEGGKLAWACTTYLDRTGQRHERAAVNRLALLAVRQAGDVVGQVRHLQELARAVARLRQFDEAIKHLDEAVTLSQTLDNVDCRASILLSYTRVLELQHRHAEALHYAENALALLNNTAHQLRRADALMAISTQRVWLGQSADALPLAEQALDTYSNFVYRDREAAALKTLGFVHRGLDHHSQAIACYERSLAIDRQIGARYWEAFVLDQIGDIYHTIGQLPEAQKAWHQALAILDTLRHPEAEPIRIKIATPAEHTTSSHRHP
jgi:tetratricopeptide (TPR) repeat protein